MKKEALLQKKLARSPIARAIYDELADSGRGYTLRELHDLLGGDRRHLSRRVAELRKLGGVFIVSWLRQDGVPGDFAPVYWVKTNHRQVDAKRPAPLTSAQIARRQRERRRTAYRVMYVLRRGVEVNPFGQLAGFFNKPTGVRQAIETDAIRMFKDGMRVAQIARELSCSQWTVRRALQDNGLYTPRHRTHVDDIRETVYAMADEGIAKTKIAQSVGVCRMTVYKILKERPEHERVRRAA